VLRSLRYVPAFVPDALVCGESAKLSFGRGRGIERGQFGLFPKEGHVFAVDLR
jgi:hypothetical protein